MESKLIRWRKKGSLAFGSWYGLIKTTKTEYIVKFPIAPLFLKKGLFDVETKESK